MVAYLKKVWKIKSFRLATFVAFVILIVTASFIYFSIYNQKSISLNDERLKEVYLQDGETRYSGKYNSEVISVTVMPHGLNEVAVTYRLPECRIFTYTVIKNINENSDYYPDEVKIFEGETLLFDGYYRQTADDFCLYQRDGDLYLEDMNASLFITQNPFPTDYTPPLCITAKLAYHSLAEKRGSIGPLFLFVFVLVLYIIDVKNPRLFFTLNHCISVKDPEPSHFYLTMQKLSWYLINPLLLIICLLWAVW